jgi:ABC-type transport system involved in multi-copper enzyme maturation permease subunit
MNSAFLLGALSPWIKPLWIVGVGAAGVLLTLYILYWIMRLCSAKLAAIAWATAKEGLSQPLFYILTSLGVFLLILVVFLSYFTFGEDLKMLEDSSLMLMMLLTIFLALWTAGLSVAEEIEGKTALTVLSKPIKRWHFVVGKFFGILGPVVVMFVVFGAVFLGTISYKVKYDARETSNPEPTVQQCQSEMIKVVPAVALTFLEVSIFAAIGVAISTRLPIIPNLVICLAIFCLGHLVPLLAKSAVGQLEIVPFFADLLAAVLPVLDNFNFSNAISMGKAISWSYVGMSGLYAALYCTMAMLVAMLLFEDRDLA